MSIVEFPIPTTQVPVPNSTPAPAQSQALHRLAEVRRQQGVSRRTLARRLNTDVGTVRRQEEETTDLPLSVLYRWQKILDVPIADLLVETGDALSTPVFKRAQLLRVMKTVMAIVERTNQTSVKRLAQMLVEQLTEAMPELKDVPAWHVVGQRRRLDEYGAAAQRRLSTDIFMEY